MVSRQPSCFEGFPTRFRTVCLLQFSVGGWRLKAREFMLRDVPDEAGQFTCDRRDHAFGVFPALDHVRITVAEAFLGIPGACLGVVGRIATFTLQMMCLAWWKTIRPRAFNEDASRDAVAGFRNLADTAPTATAVLTRRQTEIRHEGGRLVEAAEIAEFGDQGEGGQLVDAAQRPQGLHHQLP